MGVHPDTVMGLRGNGHYIFQQMSLRSSPLVRFGKGMVRWMIFIPTSFIQVQETLSCCHSRLCYCPM